MEGPYISPEDGRARRASARRTCATAAIDDFERRQDAADGRIVLVTLAPEVPGATALIEHLAASGVRVAIGHTAATPLQIADAIAAGATLATHLGNGCAADPAAPSERDLGAARGRRRVREPDRRRPSPAAVDGEGHGPRQGRRDGRFS